MSVSAVTCVTVLLCLSFSASTASTNTAALYISSEDGCKQPIMTSSALYTAGHTADLPLCHLTDALEAVRELRRLRYWQNNTPVTLLIAGTHFLSSPLALTNRDSHLRFISWMERHRSLPARHRLRHLPAITGAIPITGWRVDTPSGLLEATVPSNTSYFTQLWVGDGRQPRARAPNAVDPATRGMDDASTYQWTGTLSPCQGQHCPHNMHFCLHLGLADNNSLMTRLYMSGREQARLCLQWK